MANLNYSQSTFIMREMNSLKALTQLKVRRNAKLNEIDLE